MCFKTALIWGLATIVLLFAF
jgi:multidrug resistance protein, MATE family